MKSQRKNTQLLEEPISALNLKTQYTEVRSDSDKSKKEFLECD